MYNINNKKNDWKNESIVWAAREIALLKDDSKSDKKLSKDNKKLADSIYRIYYDYINIIKKEDESIYAHELIIKLLTKTPLTTIEDNDEDWEICDEIPTDGFSIYKCKRYNTLFKKELKNGDSTTVSYTDTSRAICIDVDTGNYYNNRAFENCILDEVVPITMPYTVGTNIKIFTESFIYRGNEIDTIGILYLQFPNETIKEVKRFFKKDYKTKEMVEISFGEYVKRRKICNIRNKKDTRCENINKKG